MKLLVDKGVDVIFVGLVKMWCLFVIFGVKVIWCDINDFIGIFDVMIVISFLLCVFFMVEKMIFVVVFYFFVEVELVNYWCVCMLGVGFKVGFCWWGS